MKLITISLLGIVLLCSSATAKPASKTFTTEWESLKTYDCPEWFRDAKFGIWSHWGPQSVPGVDGWYGRHLFVQGHRANKHHLKHYGHPSEHGMEAVFKDWRAEKWDPKSQMALFKKFGARYFVSMGVHHDNFDLWDSKFNPWNATKMGPKRNVVGEWAAAAKEQGLPFGLSEHLGASKWYYRTAHGADKTGPKKGVPYVGNKLELNSLYYSPPVKGDPYWYTRDIGFASMWNLRMKDMIDKYKPDLFYSDGGLPFGLYGRDVLAHYYNTSLKASNGRANGVYAYKSHGANNDNDQFSKQAGTHDVERGGISGISKEPWQTDTSIGDWFYNPSYRCKRSDGTRGMYRDPEWVIRTLVDVVSKNGNMLLNVVQRGDGSIDDEAIQLMTQVGAWLDIHGEAIYGTRPWKIFGEGPVTEKKAGAMKEDFGFSAKDIRFTTKKGVLYAIALGWPESGKLNIRTLKSSAGKIKSLSLIGSDATIQWKQTDEGLNIELPAKATSKLACVLKIESTELVK